MTQTPANLLLAGPRGEPVSPHVSRRAPEFLSRPACGATPAFRNPTRAAGPRGGCWSPAPIPSRAGTYPRESSRHRGREAAQEAPETSLLNTGRGP